jgi:hypoxanthine phosphoribosyltransferase
MQVAGSGYEPDIILAIARGGLIPAGSLGYALSVKNTFTMNVEYYTGVNSRLDVPVILPPYLDLVDLDDRWRRTDKWILFPWSSDDPVAQPKAGARVAAEK